MRRDRTQHGQRPGTGRGRAALAALCALVLAGPAVSADRGATRSPAVAGSLAAPVGPAMGLLDDLCHTRYTGSFNRSRCAEDQLEAIRYLMAYGTDAGLFREGELVESYIFKDALSFNTLVGFPSKDPLMRCLSGDAPFFSDIFAPTDYGSIWACVKRLDPGAARFEQP